jgi:hypothetical protein
MREPSKQAANEPSPEWNISKISVGGGLAGLIVTVGLLTIFVVGAESARWFLAVSVLAGLVVALILRRTARDR